MFEEPDNNFAAGVHDGLIDADRKPEDRGVFRIGDSAAYRRGYKKTLSAVQRVRDRRQQDR